MNTITSIIINREIMHAEQIAMGLRAVTQEIFAPAKPKADSSNQYPLDVTTTMPAQVGGSSAPPVTIHQQIQELTSREAQLQAQLNDVRERLTYLQDSNYTRFPKEQV